MVVYSIKEIEKLSGVKAHTLRIWEKRYDIIQPKRTKTNIRFYNDEDLKKILNISFLNKHGIKISKIACLSREEVKRKISEISNVDEAFEDHIDALVLSILELDGYGCNKIIDQHISQLGFEKTMHDLVYPMMDKMGLMWMAGSLKMVHESFISNIVKTKTIQAIDKLGNLKYENQPYILIYLPEKEDHELSILYFNYILKKLKINVLNLGTSINLEDLEDAYNIVKPKYLFTIFNDSYSGQDLTVYVDRLKQICRCDTKLLLTGHRAVFQGLQSDDYCSIFKNMEDTIQFLNKELEELS